MFKSGNLHRNQEATYENTELFKTVTHICNFTTKRLGAGIDWSKFKVIKRGKWEVFRHRQGHSKPLTYAFINDRGLREKEIVA